MGDNRNNSDVVNIKVIGTGCPTCKKLHESVVSAVKELDLDISVEYATDVQAMLDLGVMSSPILVVNDVPVAVGQVPSFEKIKQFITDVGKNENAVEEKPTSSCGCSCGGKC
jgi:small redox-active disulfide protein 2